MRKHFMILFLIIFALLLCSCDTEPAESSSNLPESSSASEPEKVKLPPPPAESSSSETSSYSGSAFHDDPDTTYLGKAEDIEVYKKAVETGKMRPVIVYGKDGVFNTTTETPATEYWIIDSEGNLLIDHPFYDMRFWEGSDIFGMELYNTSGIQGCYEGNLYIYSFIDGKFEIIEFHEVGAFEPVENHPEYIRTRYSYSKRESHYGLNDADGNVIFEPVFSYYVRIPFENRFILSTNNVDRMDSWESYTALLDENHDILCMYSTIYFIFFDDGSYVGIAWYSGYGNESGNLLYDKNGEILKKGYRFIDKDGNELSPCFRSELLINGEHEYVEDHFDEIITVIDENGNTVEFTGRDFVCEP